MKLMYFMERGACLGSKGEGKKDPEKGGRALKDLLRPWVVTAIGQRDKALVTVRMDAQPKTNIQKSKHHDNAQITEIVDYELIQSHNLFYY